MRPVTGDDVAAIEGLIRSLDTADVIVADIRRVLSVGSDPGKF